MMEAHRKWAKNYGHTLLDMLEWYIFGVYSDITKNIIRAEVDKRLREIRDYEEEVSAAEWEDFEYEQALLTEEVRDELRKIYLAFFYEPAELAAVHAGEKSPATL